MRSIVNSEILAVKEYEKFVKSPYPNSDFSIGRQISRQTVLSNFVENLLLYDKIYVVTTSFEELITIKNWIGGHNLQSLLHDGVIKFLQLPFLWCYIQKWKKERGHRSFYGLATVGLANEKAIGLVGASGLGELNETLLGEWSNPDIEKAVAYTLTKFHGWSPNKVGKFARLVARNSTQLRSEEFRGFITRKTEGDLSNPQMLKLVGMTDSVDIENIPDNSQDIRRLFRILHANQNIAIMQNTIEADLLAEGFFTEALQYPLVAELRRAKLKKDVDELFQLEKIPVPKGLGFEKDLMIEDILKLRNSREGQQFREWVHKNFEAEDDIKSSYVQLLRRELPFVYRIVNVVAPALMSSMIGGGNKVVDFVVDSSLGTVSEFKLKTFVERYLRPNPPRIFIDKLKAKYIRDLDLTDDQLLNTK